jgi:hypothetical protein
MSRYVLDASIAVKLYVPEVHSRITDGISIQIDDQLGTLTREPLKKALDF